MNKKIKVIGSVLVVLLLVAGVIALNNGRLAAANVTTKAPEDGNNIISVSGEGVVRLAPDVAFVTLGVETSDKDVGVAQNNNRTTMNAVVAELKRLGIKEENIQTQTYNVYPDYRWEDNRNILVGYRVTNLVRVKITDIEKAGAIIDAAAAKGANMVQGIQFTVSDEKKAYREAMLLALKDAEDKAKAMAGYFGITKLSPVSMAEGGQSIIYPPVPMPRAMEAEMDASTVISPGELEVRAQVSVGFKY